MGLAEIVVVGLLVAVAGLSALARRLALPYPIVLVLGGALLGFVPGLPLAAAFVLGVIVSPTDPLAAATIMRRLGVPRRLVSAVGGEGLGNDATALVAYRVAVATVVAGSFSVAEAGLAFVLGAAGGVAIGLVASSTRSCSC